MEIIVRGARVLDPSSPFHQQTVDIALRDGIITEVASRLDISSAQVIDFPGLHLTPGWLDVFSHFCDPGFEYKETLESGARSAAAGGYTDVLVVPNTSPVVHNKAAVAYVVERSRTLPVRIHPIGAVSRNTEGKELAEMYDMHAAGALAFSDGTLPVQSSGLFLKALQYVVAINKTIIQLPDDRSLAPHGLMHEGVESTQLGLPGKPAIAEELMIARDIELVKYTGSSIHFTGISTARSLELVRQAKAEGHKVSCSVTPYHLYFCDEDLREYDTNLKVNPPLRTRADREALRAGLLDGSIDCVAAHHFPQDKDHKVVEFEYAHWGMIGLETALAVVKTSLPQISVERLAEVFCFAPRRLFDLAPAPIQPGTEASLTMFLPDTSFTPLAYRSLSRNTPFTGQTLTGKVIGIINKRTVFLNQ
ncbi:MAG TPA: dihydroorotase [Chitinophagaceae bacterium]|jgi:dihydroorotase|nr:dihydroorotase [Chitinophagaceae bacterium]